MRAVSILIIVTMLCTARISQAAEAAPQQNSVLSQIQGGSSDGSNGSGGNGVFSAGFSGDSGASRATQLQQQIMSAPPSQKAQVASDLGSYGVPLPGPAPAFSAALTSLDATDQQALFGDLTSDLTAPAAGPVSQAASSTSSNDVGFGTMGVQASSGSRKLMQFA